jgi:Zn-finger domain-containing protein
MAAVCQGTKSKNDMIVEAVEQYKDMYVRAKTNFAKVISVMIGVNFIKCRSRLTHVRAFGSTLKGIIDRMRAAIIDEAVHRVALVDITTMAALLPLTEGVGVEEEGARRREILEVPQYLDDRTPQTGQVELPPAKVQDQGAIATTVRLPVR